MRTYHGSGHSYLVCPRLLEMDKRHGEHPSKWAACRRGEVCGRPHKHEKALFDPEGHMVTDFYWLPGCRPPSPAEHPECVCGRRLVLADLDDLYGEQHLAPEAVADGN